MGKIFRNFFVPSVHNVLGPSQVQFLHLKSCLTGDAADLIKNSQITEAKYAGAWADLKTEYGNQRVFTSANNFKMFSSKGVSESTPAELKRLLDAFKQSILAFRAINKPLDVCDELLLYVVSPKLDKFTRIGWQT